MVKVGVTLMVRSALAVKQSSLTSIARVCNDGPPRRLRISVMSPVHEVHFVCMYVFKYLPLAFSHFGNA